ncbi:hypothetical protein [Pseudomonas asiatica]|uniref:Sulfotransferase domain-containing protein n=1 Tax=Pseudomonas asiatica TaxID=2219225 RepID=A0ABU5L1B5_9PSED|nr:hypothetical protein [Pseudomonas asiatica]MDZ5739557.1 hypothetical protein [Pseudomonas asiatica]MDZ5746379.1 hypothetical protein [Pseudomonas asiatica]MDZ5751211.1 hypothetical protein [Pseudomonas asiatica]MDZ5754072.1 hypothetical protein [Pseudomonas asiatica]
MLVSVCGMPRSGSTYSFNIVRELLGVRGGCDVAASLVTDQVIRDSTSKHVIIKNHDVDAYGVRLLKIEAMKGICTIRNPFEAIESWMDVFGFDLSQAIDDFRKWLFSYNNFSQSVLVVKFEDVEKSPLRVSWSIARYLGLMVGPGEIWELKKKYSKASVRQASLQLKKDAAGVLDLGFSYFDKANFFHRRHVREEKRVFLSASDRKHILNEIDGLEQFCKAHAFPIIE